MHLNYVTNIRRISRKQKSPINLINTGERLCSENVDSPDCPEGNNSLIFIQKEFFKVISIFNTKTSLRLSSSLLKETSSVYPYSQ